MAAKVRLPRKRLFSLQGNQVELAIGLLLVTILEANSAEATVTRDGLTADLAAAPDAATPPTLENMLGVEPDAVATISIDELKAHLTTAVLANLGLDDKFFDLLDNDRAAAINELEDAYQQKLAQLAGEGGHIAVADGGDAGQADSAQGDDSSAGGDGSDGQDDSGDQDAGFLGIGHDLLPLFILAGVAGVAAAGVIATHTDGHKEHPPVATNDTVTTNEDTSITFDVRTNDSDPDGDSLTVTQINGTAIDATHPVTVTGGVISIGTDGRLTFTPTANYNGTPTFTYTISDGRGGTATGTVNLTVTAVNDAPVNTVPSGVTVAGGSVVAISGLSVSDVDGGTGYTTTIKVGNGVLSIIGAVTGGATVSGLNTNTLTLTGTIDQINATLKAIGYTSGTGFAGTTQLTITTSDGQLTDTDTVTLTVTTALSGVAEDGLISGGHVYINGVDTGILTGADGKFALTSLVGTGVISIVGGTNVDTGLPNLVTLTAPIGASVINPLTTLIVGLMSSGLSLAEANAHLASAFGLTGVDFTNFDFLSPDSDPVLSLALQKVATEVVTLLVMASAGSGANAADIQASILAHIIAAINSGAAIDLTDAATLHDLLAGSGLSESQMSLISAQVASINAAIAAATSSSDIAHVVGESYPGGSSPPSADTLPVSQDTLADIVAHAADYAALGITTLNAVNGTITLTDSQAGALAAAGLHFAEANTVTLDAEEAELSTTLKSLESLNVDIIMITGSALTINAGSGLDGIALANLPQIVGSGDVSVTLNVTAGTLGSSLDVTALAQALHNAGIDHIGVTGGELILTDVQATDLVQGGLDIQPAADVGLLATGDAIHSLVTDLVDHGSISVLTEASVDHLDVVGDTITLSDAEAGALSHAGIDFVLDDDVTVSADGTHLSTSLKGLENLHVDTIMISGGSLTIEAGTGLGGISVTDLPHFVGAGGADPSVTLDVTAGTIDPTVDLTSLADSLHNAGIDHISVTGGELILTDAQATELVHGGLDITPASDVGLTATADEVHALIADAVANAGTSVLTGASVDHLDVVGDNITLTDAEAGTLATAGIDFATDDNVTVSAGGTHLSTSLKSLESLHVDTVTISGGALTIEAGSGLGGISTTDLPHFVGASSVTLDVSAGTVDSSLDLTSLASSLQDAGVDHIGITGGELVLTDAQATELVHGGLDITAASDVGLTATADEVHALIADAVANAGTSVLTEASVDHIDVVGDNITLTDAEAGTLATAGIDFATDDNVSVSAGGTHLSTSLKSLESLHVDTVTISGGALTIEAGSGLGGISTTDLPHFVGASSVTLDVSAGTVDSSLDLTSLASSLHDAGVDHIGVTGGELVLTDAQATELVHGGLDITAASDVGLTVTADEVHALVTDVLTNGAGSVLTEASVDHLDVVGDNVTLTDTEAGALAAAGVDFATGDHVTVSGDGTHLSTSMKGLADLHVDTVMITGHSIMIDAGASLATLSTETLPHIVAAGGADADVTLNVASGTLDPTADVSSIAQSLVTAGVDHIGVSGDGSLTLTADQAIAFADAGLNFAHDADITMDLTVAQLSLLTADPAGVYGFGIDHLHVDGGAVTLTDADASSLVAAGVDFVSSDDVHVHAAGTHMSSTLSDLQSLHVDSVAVGAGVTDLHINAGDLSTVSASDLPQFDVDQSNASLDVTLHIDRTQLYDLDRLGTSLKDAGIDHFGLDQPLDSYDAATQAYMAQITHDTGIDFVYDPQPATAVQDYSGFGQDSVQSDDGLVQSIITAFQELEDHGTGGQVVVQDDVIPALAESGALRAYTADTLVVDGSHSGDLLLTTLKDIADLGVDHVVVGNTGGPAYVDIGSFTGDELTQVKDLFTTLDENVTGSKIFEGNSSVALVVDESVAHALSQVDGSMEKLASLGFTEVDVLMDAGSTTSPISTTAVEVKLIGQDDDLYKHLHHGA